jgi:hypothetical protein
VHPHVHAAQRDGRRDERRRCAEAACARARDDSHREEVRRVQARERPDVARGREPSKRPRRQREAWPHPADERLEHLGADEIAQRERRPERDQQRDPPLAPERPDRRDDRHAHEDAEPARRQDDGHAIEQGAAARVQGSEDQLLRVRVVIDRHLFRALRTARAGAPR